MGLFSYNSFANTKLNTYIVQLVLFIIAVFNKVASHKLP
jgi:hypothetical protein